VLVAVLAIVALRSRPTPAEDTPSSPNTPAMSGKESP
jgi:hypothetical protein